MKWCIYPTSLTLSFVLVSLVYARASHAQVTTDQTLPVPTQVTPDGLNFTIDGGTQAGGNLFHSFREFSVPEMGEAFFNNAVDVQHIFSRVTGGSVSDIQGVIRANGTANLFLLNPAGIVFGPDARLEIGGSFFGSTADSVVFSDNVVFSATDTNPQPLLTINVPIGLQFGAAPGDIQVQGGGIPNRDEISPLPDDPTAEDFSLQQRTFLSSIGGLRVSPGKTLGLVGGNLTFSGGLIQAPEGRLELGSVGAGSRVNIGTSETGFALNYEGVQNFQDIGLAGRSGVFASGERGGDIQVRGRNLGLTDGSEIRSLTLGSGSGGSLLVNTSEAISLSGQFTELDGNTQNNVLGTGSYGSGKAGEINLTTGSLQLQDESSIYIFTLNADSAETGNVTVNARSVQLNGDSFLGLVTLGTGRVGDLTVNATESIEVNSDSTLAAVTIGEGEAGNVYLNTQRFTAQDEGNVATLTVERDNLGFNTRNPVTRAKKVGNIEIQAFDSIDILRGGSLLAGTTGESVGGNIILTTPTLRVQDGASVEASTSGTGSAGSITVKPPEEIEPESIELSGGGELTARTTGEGSAGSVTLTTGELIVRDRGRVETLTTESTARTDENGRISNYAGDITVTASESVELTSEPIGLIGPPLEADMNSGLYAGTEGTGDAGTITINTPELRVQDRARVVASTESTGSGGEIIVNAPESVILNGFGNISVSTEGAGNADSITITTPQLIVQNGASIVASTESTGRAGNITIQPPEQIETASSSVELNAGFLVAGTSAEGDAGNVDIKTGEFLAQNGSLVITWTTNSGQGGAIDIIASESIELREKGALLAGTTGEGSARNVTLTTGELIVRNGGRVVAATTGTNDARTNSAGNITITAFDSVEIRGLSTDGETESRLLTNTTGTGDAGNITINTPRLRVLDGASIIAGTESIGNAGTVEIGTSEFTVRDGAIIFVASTGTGLPGEISVTADDIRLENEGFLFAYSEAGEGGDVTLRATDTRLDSLSAILAFGQDETLGGDVDIQSDLLILFRNSSAVITADEDPYDDYVVDDDIEGGNVTLYPNSEEFLILFKCNTCIISSRATLLVFDELPNPQVVYTEPIDVNSLIRDDVCEVGVGSEFIIPGAGGIPPSPLEPLPGSGVVEIDWIEFLSEENDREVVPQPENEASDEDSQLPQYKPLVEAQGWIVVENGQIILVAESPTVTPAAPALNRIDCHSDE